MLMWEVWSRGKSWVSFRGWRFPRGSTRVVEPVIFDLTFFEWPGILSEHYGRRVRFLNAASTRSGWSLDSRMPHIHFRRQRAAAHREAKLRVVLSRPFVTEARTLRPGADPQPPCPKSDTSSS